MDEEFDSEIKEMSDDETTAPPVPIWLREPYAAEDLDPKLTNAEDLDLEPTNSEVSSAEKEEDPFAFLQTKKDWYISIESTDGKRIAYDKKEIKTRLRANILAGKHDRNSSAIIFTKRLPMFPTFKDNRPLENKWNQKVTTLKEFGKKHFAVGALYQPIWSYAKAGLKWGAIIGIILNSISFSINIFPTNPVMAFLVTTGILLYFVPKYGKMFFFLVLFNAYQNPDAAFFLPTVLVVALVGAGLFCLPGMTIGGLIGWGRRRFIPRAHDAVPEPKSVLVKAVLLPFLGGSAVIITYLFVAFQVLLPLLYSLREKMAMQG